jgi:hypothetical protein
MLYVIMLNVIMLNVIMLNVTMLNVIMLNVIMLNGIIPSVLAPFFYTPPSLLLVFSRLYFDDFFAIELMLTEIWRDLKKTLALITILSFAKK